MALKVLSHGTGSRELEIMLRIRDASPHPGAENVVQLLDYFEHIGPNGSHLCLVLELMWNTLSAFMGPYCEPYDSEMRLQLAKPISKQILTGLDFLHNSCGLIHNGNCHF